MRFVWLITQFLLNNLSLISLINSKNSIIMNVKFIWNFWSEVGERVLSTWKLLVFKASRNARIAPPTKPHHICFLKEAIFFIIKFRFNIACSIESQKKMHFVMKHAIFMFAVMTFDGFWLTYTKGFASAISLCYVVCEATQQQKKLKCSRFLSHFRDEICTFFFIEIKFW